MGKSGRGDWGVSLVDGDSHGMRSWPVRVKKNRHMVLALLNPSRAAAPVRLGGADPFGFDATTSPPNPNR